MITICNSNQDLEDTITSTIKTHLYFVKAHRFLRAGDENRSFAALCAYRKRERWTYSFSLEAVISYEQNKSKLNPTLLEAIKEKDTVYSPHLRELTRNLIRSRTHQTT